MDKDRQFIAPRLALFEDEWVFFLSPGAFRALFYLIALAKKESSQKNPGRCKRVTHKKAAHDWRVSAEDVAEMEAAALVGDGERPFLAIDGDYWTITDLSIFQSAKTQKRDADWEAANVPPTPQEEAFVPETETDEEICEEELTNDATNDVCPTNGSNVGQTLSQRVESRDSLLVTNQNLVIPPSGGTSSAKGFSSGKFGLWFEEQFKPAYPKRNGGYEWPTAKKRLEALFRARSVHPDCVLQGAARYRAALQAQGKEGSEFVKQASSWVNARGWEDEYGDGGEGVAVEGPPPKTPEEIEAEAQARRERLAR